MIEIGYIKANGISYSGTIPKIKKSTEQLKPIFEAFTNALESIKLSGKELKAGEITIKLNFNKTLYSQQEKQYDFDSIVIEDSGIGFTDPEIKRMASLNDTTKGFFNKGSGRIQFLHFFERTIFKSVFADNSSATGFKERTFTLSKSSAFLKENAIIFHESIKEIKANGPLTTLTFKTPLSQKELEYYQKLSLDELKEKIVTRYLPFFCENRDSLPEIKLEYYVNQNIEKDLKIQAKDIPTIDKHKDVVVRYSKVTVDGKIEKSENSETLNLKGFKINKDHLDKNGLFLTSKGEIAKKIRLENLLPDEYIGSNRYLFLLSGDFINNKDGDTRGVLNIPNIDEFKRSLNEGDSLFSEEEILLDDIQDEANTVIQELYDEINEKNKEKLQRIEELKTMFLLSSDSIADAKIKINDSEERILEKVYEADARLIARKDAEIKNRIDALNHLDPAKPNFEEQFENEITELAKVIPLQNRASLTHYIARRKLVIELFRKILDRELDIQLKTDRKFDEKLLHNLLFQQGSDDAEKSDLWIINEDFIYFKGTSESRLCDVQVDGRKLFKPKFSEEEEKYLTSFGENRKIKKPDVLLFPEEGKCIIIEFKDPAVNASVHLTQVDYYASLIRNFTIDEIQMTTFYGYLIGENIEAKDVRGRVTGYEYSYHFDYLFRPSQKVVGDLGDVVRSDGAIYCEVIKYSTLVDRAERRNKIFIEKL
jgi:hypothetical protein